MTVCRRCNHPLLNASPDGYGPKCRKLMAAIPAIDLFNDSPESRVRVSIETAAAQAYIATRDDFRRARVELLGWEARP